MDNEEVREKSFQVPFSPENIINLETRPINSNSERQDKKVVIFDKNGNGYASSSIMMGYNKKGYELSDGNFVNADELITAINDAVSRYESGTVIVNKKTEKVLNVNELIEMLKEAKGSLILGSASAVIKNQDSATLKIKSTDGREDKKGVLFLGNHGLKLKTGEYVSLDEFLIALNDYVAVQRISKPEPPISKPVSDSNPVLEDDISKSKSKTNDFVSDDIKIVRVTRKYKNKASIWLAILGCMAVLLSGFSKKDNIQTIKVPVDVVSSIQYESGQEILYFEIDGIIYGYEPSSSTVKRVTENLTFGDELNVEDGKTFNTNGLETGVSKTMGQEFTKEGKYSGNYRITGFALVKDGKVLNYVEDFDGLNDTTKLKDIIDQTLKENNLQFDDLQIKVHLGVNGDYSRLGWIDISELINADTITDDMILEVANRVSIDKGTVKNFTGDYITLSNGVTLKITDEDGNLLSKGSTIIGSDGEEYIINNLLLKDETKTVETNFTNVRYETKEVVTGKNLEWNITDCNLALGIAPLLSAAAFAVANKKKNENEQKNPSFFEFENNDEYLKFKKEFEDAKLKYESSSKFNQVLKSIFFRKRVDLMQKLSNEQSSELYRVVMNHAGKDFVFGDNDRISFRDGRVFVNYFDGHYADITDIVMSDIYSIGQNDEIISKGRLR